MKAIVIKEFGSVDNLTITDVSVPSIQANEVLLEVKAISINPVDVKTRQGKGMAGRLKAYMPLILGWDISGVVVEVGANVSQFKKGDNVFGMVNFPGLGNAYAQYVAAPANHLALKPATFSHEEAAAATLAALTAWQALVTKANVQAGQKVLVHAAAGGVGHYTVQLAKHLGAYVIGTSSAENKDFVLSIGADEHIDYRTQRFEEIVQEADFVLDTMGGDTFVRSLEVTKRGGTVICIPGGLAEENVEIARNKGINAYFFLVESNGEDMQQLANLASQGILRSHVSHTFNFDQMGLAHQQVETGKTRGKVVVNV